MKTPSLTLVLLVCGVLAGCDKPNASFIGDGGADLIGGNLDLAGADFSGADFSGADLVGVVCGNNVVEPGEDCDDGDTDADFLCTATCHFTCGDGVVDPTFDETCDTGITSGDGACPTSCDDGDACTNDVLSGSGCAAKCEHAAIAAPADGDGCCPSGANATTDSDCTAECGNGTVEDGETCDTGINDAGGACPTTCADADACTVDAIANEGTCTAACTHTTITATENGDGCCPAGATHDTDTDCAVDCGNGMVDTGETCDTAITAGEGACPMACNDGNSCTKDTLANPNTCTAACTSTPITTPTNGDGCCPTGANANNDNDCKASCGNKIVEPGEDCDDGDKDDNDECKNNCTFGVVPTAYRITSLALRDPHVFVDAFGCRDVTDTQFFGFSVNNEIKTAVQEDGDDADAFYDLSIVTVFRPLDQVNAHTTPLEINFANCTTDTPSVCTGTTGSTMTTATNKATGACLTLDGVRPYSPAVTVPTDSCYSSATTTLALTLGGIPITLSDAQIAAVYVGTPATTTVNGLLKGFISEADANVTVIPDSFPLVGGKPLSVLLRGGDPPGDDKNCASGTDKDTKGGVAGWWFYLNFTAGKVTWSGN